MSGRPHALSLTAEDYYNPPDNGMRYWLIEGELYRFDENMNEPVTQTKSPAKATSPLFPGLTIETDAISRPAL